MIVRELLWALGFKVNDNPIDRAEKKLKALDSTADRTKSSFSGVGSAIQSAAAALNIFDRMLSGGRFLLNTITDFEQLRAQLVTIEQDEKKAASAFQRIQDFATSTPFQLQNVTQAFARLRSLGLNPTNEDLTGLGNVAAAWGKDITDYAQAVTGAVTGEMEMLKGFGIVAKQEGEKVTFLFDGQKKTVKKDAKEISKFLFGLGKTRFAGAMERQMNTINGAISNLMDNVSKFADRVGQFGLAKEINLFARELTGAVGEGDDLAETLGKGLADGVRMLRELFKFAKDNADLLTLALEALMAAVAIDKMTTFVGMMMKLAAAVGLPLIPFLLLTALVVGFGLAVTDLIGFLQGKESVIGQFFEAFGIAEETGRTIAKFMLLMMALPLIILGFIPTVIGAIIYFWDDIKAAFSKGIQWIKDQWAAFWGGSFLKKHVKSGMLGAMKGLAPNAMRALEFAGVIDTSSTAAMIGGGAADPGVDTRRRINEVANNRKEVNVNASIPITVEGGGDSAGMVDELTGRLEEKLNDIFSGAAADLEGAVD